MDKKNCDMCGHNCAGGSCSCGMHMDCGHHSRKYLLKVILKLIILALIFMFGFQLGQMTGYIKAQYGGYEYGRGMMGRINNYGGGMMNGYYGQVTPLVTTPAPTK